MLILIFLAMFNMGTIFSVFAGKQFLAEKDPPYERHHYEKKCSKLSHKMGKFSDKLNDANLKIFCSEFDDTEREQAMQMASQKDANGNLTMTPNESVEMVAAKRTKHYP